MKFAARIMDMAVWRLQLGYWFRTVITAVRMRHEEHQADVQVFFFVDSFTPTILLPHRG